MGVRDECDIVPAFSFFEREPASELARVRERAGAGGERISSKPPHSARSPTWGSIPRPWDDHNLSQNQESDASPTEPPRRPNIVPAFKMVVV